MYNEWIDKDSRNDIKLEWFWIVLVLDWIFDVYTRSFSHHTLLLSHNKTNSTDNYMLHRENMMASFG